MEGHAAFPDLKNLKRVLGVVAKAVEQHIAKPSAQNHTSDDPRHQIFELFGGHRRGVCRPKRGLFERLCDHPPAQSDSSDVSEGIPTQRKLHPEERDGKDFR